MSGWSMDEVAAMAANDIPDGAHVNLGIGLPERVANFVPDGREFVFHSENGILGMGPQEAESLWDSDLINAGKKPVSLLKGGSFFHHADSFVMIRGGHIDICILGAFEVSVAGDLANWCAAGDTAIPAVGGAMDLAVGAKSVRVITRHTAKGQSPKLVKQLGLPATARAVVGRIYTELAVMEPRGDAFVARRLFPSCSKEELQSLTAAPIKFELELSD
jgi:3-oxoadipate CoA-transferase, beta subunit